MSAACSLPDDGARPSGAPVTPAAAAPMNTHGRSVPSAPRTPSAGEGPESGPYSPERTAAVRERLRADMRRRPQLGRRARRALDGIVHALKPDGLEASLPDRVLLEYDLEGPRAPVAVVAVGDPFTATHVTWMVSGMGIRAETAMWGAVHEAGNLWAAQRAAGAPRPVTIAWLGYRAPHALATVLDGPARTGAAALADHLERCWDQLRRTHPGAVPQVHLGLEAHSYGTVVAAHALELLQQRRQAGAAVPALDVLVLSGAIGLPRRLARAPERMGLDASRIYEASAPHDRLARLGRLTGRRLPWAGVRALPVAAGVEEAADGIALVGAAVSGHDTSRWDPQAGEDAPRGYRDPGTVTLAATARVTAGLPLPQPSD